MCATSVFSQNGKTGSMRGAVTAADTKLPLPFANILIVGTNNGAATDAEGKYILRNIAPGKQQIKISYLGYKTKIIKVDIKPDKITELNVALEITAVKGKEVVVTAQRVGQQQAINEQINSNVIKNVVAADRLQGNPEANVAEAIGRLPGISLIRSGGVGVGIVIRGMNPSYSQIYLDGIELPTTNISGISQYALQGVEVFKSITPDMNGDAVAGEINLRLGEAPKGLKYSLMTQSGYNHLNNELKNYKFHGGISDRFFNNKLGVMLNLDAERENRSAQTLSANYVTKAVPTPGQLAPLYVNSIGLNDQTRINHRIAGTLVFDRSEEHTSELQSH